MYPRNPLRLPNDVLSRLALRLPSSNAHILPPLQPPPTATPFSHNTSPGGKSSLRFYLFVLCSSIFLFFHFLFFLLLLHVSPSTPSSFIPFLAFFSGEPMQMRVLEYSCRGDGNRKNSIVEINVLHHPRRYQPPLRVCLDSAPDSRFFAPLLSSSSIFNNTTRPQPRAVSIARIMPSCSLDIG